MRACRWDARCHLLRRRSASPECEEDQETLKVKKPRLLTFLARVLSLCVGVCLATAVLIGGGALREARCEQKYTVSWDSPRVRAIQKRWETADFSAVRDDGSEKGTSLILANWAAANQ